MKKLIAKDMCALMNDNLTHLNAAGEAHMVDISSKVDSLRIAAAGATVTLGTAAFEQLTNGNNKKVM